MPNLGDNTWRLVIGLESSTSGDAHIMQPEAIPVKPKAATHGGTAPEEAVGSGPRLSRACRRDAIRRPQCKHYSIRTEQAYVAWIERYIYFHDVRHPDEMEAFLTHLAVKENVAASTQNP